MHKKTFILLSVLAVMGAVAMSIGFHRTSHPQPSKIRVIASFYPLYFFASAIAGESAEVTNMTPAGAEPHDYEPTAQEIVKIEKSDLLILNGGYLESWGEKIRQELRDGHTTIVEAGDSLFNKQTAENGKPAQDPHAWLSPPRAKEMAQKILQGLIQVDPSHRAIYEVNAQALADRLDTLDREYAESLRSCARKDIVTSHAAFGYLADQYHLNQIAIAGVSPDEEPSTKKLAEITDLVRASGIRYIFFESLISPKLSETIASETGAKTLVLDPIEGLRDEDIRAGKDYFSQMEMNLANLKTALACQA